MGKNEWFTHSLKHVGRRIVFWVPDTVSGGSQGLAGKVLRWLFATSLLVIAVSCAVRRGYSCYRHVQAVNRVLDMGEAELAVSDSVAYSQKGKYLYNPQTGQRLLEHVEAVMLPHKDSLGIYSDGRHYGYFNIRTGRTSIAPAYDRAWEFSEGVAAVEKNGRIHFIGRDGKQAFRETFALPTHGQDFVFNLGYCIVEYDQGSTYGLIDHDGKWALAPGYDSLRYDDGYWIFRIADHQGVLDTDLEVVFWGEYTDVEVMRGYGFFVTNSKHERQLIDYDGETLLRPLVITDTAPLTYSLPKGKEDVEEYVFTAQGRIYYSSRSHERCGLLGADGTILTPPIYTDIEALGEDLYLCMPQGDVISGEEVLNGE